MLRFLVPLVLTIATASAIQFRSPPLRSAASESQIRFALENRYDDTGPGAKRPETAYNTYKTLEEALIGYIDDPDTKLPEADREKAIQKLTLPNGEFRPEHGNEVVQRYLPKTVEEYTRGASTKPLFPKVFHKLNEVPFIQELGPLSEKYADPFRSQGRVKPSRLVQYSRDPDLQLAFDHFDPHPKYSYSYGVHVPATGDMKSAQESREGGAVRGYYSFMDADGKTRTVHYTADDLGGYRATVHREK